MSHSQSAESRSQSVQALAIAAALDVASEVHLAAVLQRLTDLARELVPSKYAALGVADEEGRIVEFITSGISALERARLGPIPQGHGLLGALIRDRKPIIVPDIASDPRSAGFPQHHPVMRTLLGVPILHGDRVLGNLYLTERLHQPAYDKNDLQAVQILASHAATAIDRAQLFQQVEISKRTAEEERDQLQVMLDNLPSAVVIHAVRDGAVELANTTAWRMTESAPTAFAFTLLRADGSSLAQRSWPHQRAMRGELVRDRQLLLQTTSGARTPVLVQAAPLRNRNGQVVRSVTVLQDITRLREAEQLKDDFLSLVSHEFRTPLTAIHGGAQLLAQRGDALESEVRTQLVLDIVSESTRLEQMLRNILTLTQIQAGRLEPASEPMLIPKLVRDAVAVVQGMAPDRQFSTHFESNLAPAEGDPDLLVQVLHNLLENAVKYSGSGSAISVSALLRDQHIVVEVTDEGSGISPEHVSTVFERFRRPGADPAIRGMGLGLYLSRHLMHAQGGEIGVRSDGPNLGATFWVRLPATSLEEQQ